MNDEFQEYLDHAQKELSVKIAASTVGISLVPERVDPKFAIELGYMIMLDKPILAVVMRGTPVPEKLRMVADEIVYIDGKEDMEKMLPALRRMMGDE